MPKHDATSGRGGAMSMRRFIEASRGVWTRPWLWLPLAVWAALTAMVHELTPNSPLYRFQMGEAHEERTRTELAGANLRQKHSPRFAGATSDGMNVFSVSAAGGDVIGPIRQWDIRHGALVTEYPQTELTIWRNTVRPFAECCARRLAAPESRSRPRTN